MTQGQQRPDDFASHLSAMVFTISQMIGRINTATLVQVMGVTSAGGLAVAGTVDVQPLVNQVDGAGGVVPHGTIYGIPYYRAQGGADAIILDPAVGDIGLAVFADHDISSVIQNRGASNPGSARQFDFSDGMYFGGFLNNIPSQYIQFNASGITISTPNNVVVNCTGSATVTADGGVSIDGQGSGVTNGIVQGQCVCAFTGAPHAMISGTVKGSI